jgi:hypothetical protein
MINFFVEASVLAFPPKAEEQFLEHENIKEFLGAIRDLDMLIDANPGASISIRSGLEDLLSKNYMFFDLNNETQKNRMNCQVNLKISPREVERIYPTLFCRTRTIRYNCINTKNTSTFEQELETIIVHISCLMNRYGVKNQRLVVSKLPQNRMDNNIQISKMNTLLKKNFNYINRFDTFESAINDIKKQYADTICFGDDVYTDKESILAKSKDKEISSPNMPDRLFYYLDNISNVAQYLQSLPNELSDNDINDIVNLFGCNSAPENKKYTNCCHRRWHDGTQKSIFILHLRPKTGNEDKNTMRIYYKWRHDIKKIIIGMICVHPPLCDNCHDFHECNPNRY